MADTHMTGLILLGDHADTIEAAAWPLSFDAIRHEPLETVAEAFDIIIPADHLASAPLLKSGTCAAFLVHDLDALERLRAMQARGDLVGPILFAPTLVARIELHRLSRPTLKAAFPKGVADVLRFWSEQSDAAILDTMAAPACNDLRIREKVAFAVRGRLDELAPHEEAARRAAALMALPGCSGALIGGASLKPVRFASSPIFILVGMGSLHSSQILDSTKIVHFPVN